VQKLHGYGFNDNMEDPPPFFVRRWAPMVKEAIFNPRYLNQLMLSELIMFLALGSFLFVFSFDMI
jgi:hypothetical protein